MSFWCDEHPVVYPVHSYGADIQDKLDNDAIAEKKEISSMPKFDRDKALKTMMEGTEDQKRALVEELSLMLEHKPYGLVWERGGTTEDSAFEAENVVLELSSGIPYPVYRNDLSTNPEKADGNMLLEGDNYIWLKMLEQTHKGKVDVIYIDPPYNTGKKDFKYNDAFVDPNDTFRHSKWLDFMYKRLTSARSLLSDDGIIFISCDDYEQVRLQMLCDEVFHEENWINTFIWIANPSGRQISSCGALTTKEYVLCYAKNAAKIGLFEHSANFLHDTMPMMYKSGGKQILTDEHGEYSLGHHLYNGNAIFNEETRPNLVFDIYYHPETGDIITEDVSDADLYAEQGYKKISPKQNNDGVHKYHAYRWSRKKVHAESYNLFFFENKGKWNVKTKVRDFDLMSLKDVLSEMTTKTGTNDFKKNGFVKTDFDHPKPVELIKLLIQSTNMKRKDQLILDFFAGSGTTAQAIEELNAEDGGKRQWILITNNEDQDADDSNPETGICRDITKPRIDAVLTGVRADNGERCGDGTGGGYEYFQYEFVGRDKRQYERNAYRFFQPYIINALTMLKYGVHQVVQDEKEKLCVYENDERRIISFFADSTPDQIQAAIDRYVENNEEKPLLLLLSEGSSYYNILKTQHSKDGIEVKYQHSLITTADYLE